uniref:Uncharacterized protein n=2 Tax=Chloropicon primus TaxID=1764295 RepID=A0A7S2WYD3_9CHLO
MTLEEVNPLLGDLPSRGNFASIASRRTTTTTTTTTLLLLCAATTTLVWGQQQGGPSSSFYDVHQGGGDLTTTSPSSPSACDLSAEQRSQLSSSPALFLGVVDATDPANAGVEFSWTFPPSLDPACASSFEIVCEELDEDLQGGMKNAKSAVQHRVGSLSPEKRNAGLAVLKGLESGRVYTCALTLPSASPPSSSSSRGEVQSRGVYLEPGFPKVLKDTSPGGAACVTGRTAGLVNATAMYVEDGCEGVFLMPGRSRRSPALGLMCSSAEGTRTECYLPDMDMDDDVFEGIEVFWQTSTEDCVPGRTFGFASREDMFVLDGCEGQFLVYRAEEDSTTTTTSPTFSSSSFVVDCGGGSRKHPSYDQKVSRRRWWCLWLCRTEADDPLGFYTCPLEPVEAYEDLDIPRRSSNLSSEGEEEDPRPVVKSSP